MRPQSDSPYADDRREARVDSLLREATRTRPLAPALREVLLARHRARLIELRQSALDALLDWNLRR